MTTRFRFFDSVENDREYTSDAWAQWSRGLVTQGYVPGIGDDLEVVASDPTAMTVEVGIGVAWVDGRYFEVYSAAEELNVPAADGSNPRIDRVVIRNDFENRETVLAVKAGTPAASPSVPSLTRSSTIYEISLAQIAVGAGVSSINSGNIADERDDPDVCGRAEPRSVSAPIIRSLDAPQGYQLKADGSGGADWEQPSDVDTHGNEAHSPNFATQSDFSGHTHSFDDLTGIPTVPLAEPGTGTNLGELLPDQTTTSSSFVLLIERTFGFWGHVQVDYEHRASSSTFEGETRVRLLRGATVIFESIDHHDQSNWQPVQENPVPESTELIAPFDVIQVHHRRISGQHEVRNLRIRADFDTFGLSTET